MANVQPPPPPDGAPSTFGELFEHMPDIYNGVYHPLLNEYEPNDQVPALELMQSTTTRLPADQIPVVFLYQDTHSTIRAIHHVHKVEAPFGQPITPLTNEYLGFSGEVYNGVAQLLKLPAATFFSATGDTVVLTAAALTAQIAAAANGLVGPLNQGDPDTEIVNTRRAVPVPHPYVRLVTFRTLTPQQAWQQLGQQIILDGREADCAVLLNFLRAATVLVRGAVRNQPPTLPITCQQEGIWFPLDGPVLEHMHRKLRQILPGLLVHQPNAPGLPIAQTVAIVNQTVAEGFEAMRADRLQEREAAAAPRSFSDIFPANAVGIRRLCLAGNDDDLIPEFWQRYANVKGKKGLGMSIFNKMVQERAGMEDSAGVTPVISTALFVNISSFDLGASDLETITQGISPFLMCPSGHTKANAIMILTQKYMLLQGENNLPLLGDIQQIVPSNDYSIPDDLHSLVDFIGAYSVVWDVLVGADHPLATTIRVHHRFWVRYVRMVLAAIPEAHLKNVVIVGTLRSIQLAVLRYVNEIMLTDRGPVVVPTFRQIEEAIHGRQFQTLPSLPAAYQQPATARNTTLSSLPLPPVVNQRPIPPNERRQSGTTGNQVVAPPQDRSQSFIDVFAASDKTIQQLRLAASQPKVKNGTGTLCLSYHLKGICCDNCRKISTHRKLDKTEHDNMQKFISSNL